MDNSMLFCDLIKPILSFIDSVSSFNCFRASLNYSSTIDLMLYIFLNKNNDFFINSELEVEHILKISLFKFQLQDFR